MATTLVSVSSHGLFASGSGPTCDYPSEDDVRDGVDYAFGAMTGNVVLPDEDDVLLGTGYGSDGTEFTGTLDVPTPPSPSPPQWGTTPFAAIAYAIVNRVSLMTGIPQAYIVPVANDKYTVTIEEPFFCYIQFYRVQEPRDPALRYTDSGAGRRSTNVGRRVRVYIYTRSSEDVAGTDFIALFGRNPSQDIATPPVYPGQFVAEEVIFNALNNWMPVSADDEPLTLTPLHPLDSSEEPERRNEDSDGLLRSCLDWEIVYNLAVDPRDPPPQ